MIPLEESLVSRAGCQTVSKARDMSGGLLADCIPGWAHFSHSENQHMIFHGGQVARKTLWNRALICNGSEKVCDTSVILILLESTVGHVKMKWNITCEMCQR